MVPYLHIFIAIPEYHGALGPFDELVCFGGLVLVAVAVFVVYGRDLFKPGPTEPTVRDHTDGKQ